jgi:hypothetical protein
MTPDHTTPLRPTAFAIGEHQRSKWNVFHPRLREGGTVVLARRQINMDHALQSQ